MKSQNRIIMHIDMNSSILGQIPLSLSFQFDLTSEEDAYRAQCVVEPFDATLLNGFIGSQFFIEFRSGHIDAMNFSFEGNNKANIGEMDLEYTKLRVQKLQGHEKYMEGRPKTGFFASVGNMLIPTNRSKDQRNYKPGVIYYEKEYNRDLVHGTVMALLSGLLSSTGFASKNMEKMQKKAEALDEISTQKSAEKAQKQADKVDKKKESAEQKEAKKEEKQEQRR